MSIRIGNTIYIDGIGPIEVEPRVAQDFERIARQYEVSQYTLDDLIANKAAGIVRVGLKR